MKYFTHFNSYSKPKNSLQKLAVSILQAESNLLIEDREAFVASLEKQIRNGNARFSNCSPLKLHIWNAQKDSFGLSLGEKITIGFYLYPVKNAGSKEAA